MKPVVVITLTAIAGIVHATPLSSQAQDQAVCNQKNPAVTNAISKFCQNNDIRIPSDYAEEGMSSDQGKYEIGVSVFINGNCNNEYVPVKYCLRQFQHMFVTFFKTFDMMRATDWS